MSGDYNKSENHAWETYSHLKLVVNLIVFQLIYKISCVKYLQYKNIDRFSQLLGWMIVSRNDIECIASLTCMYLTLCPVVFIFNCGIVCVFRERSYPALHFVQKIVVITSVLMTVLLYSLSTADVLCQGTS